MHTEVANESRNAIFILHWVRGRWELSVQPLCLRLRLRYVMITYVMSYNDSFVDIQKSSSQYANTPDHNGGTQIHL